MSKRKKSNGKMTSGELIAAGYVELGEHLRKQFAREDGSYRKRGWKFFKTKTHRTFVTPDRYFKG